MSQATSLSSLNFIRSVTDLAQKGAPAVDVDEIFSFNDVRERLAKKLLEPEEELGEGDRLSPPSAYDSLDIFTPWRVFINCVDTFNMKHLSSFISDQMYKKGMASEEMGEFGEEEDEGEMRDEEEQMGEYEPVKRKTKTEIPKTTFVVIGSLLEADGKFDKESVREIVNTRDKSIFLRTLLNCGTIIYDVSRHESQIEEARWALHAIKDFLERKEKDTPKAFKELTDIPVYILISPFLTWAKTKPADPDDPTLPFREMDYKKRKCHPNFKDHLALEKEVVAVGKIYPDKFKTMVLCSGLTYGFEEDLLHFLFKLAWENEPALPLYLPGNNMVPLIHVQDLASMVVRTIEEFPMKLKYLLAVEQNMSSLKAITKAISRSFSTGDLVKLPKEDMFLLKAVTQHHYDALTANVRMEPSHFLEDVRMKWQTDTSFSFNIGNIANEYRDAHHLTPHRIYITGPPASGKTLLAKKLATHYHLHYIDKKEIAERSTERLKFKIKRLKEREEEKRKARSEKGEASEDEDEVADEEDLGEEEGEESMERLQEVLDELLQNMESNDGNLDEPHLINCLIEILNSQPIRNQGYILDGFPERISQLKQIFIAFPDEEGAEEDLDEEEAVTGTIPYPEYIIGIIASDDYIIERVIGLPEDEIQDKHYEEDELIKRLANYREENTEDFGILTFLDEREVHPLLIFVEQDASPMLEDSFEKIIKHIGLPRNFGLSEEELEEERKIVEEHNKWEAAQLLAKKQELERQAHEEKMKKLEEWAAMIDALKEEEEEMMAADSAALRNYLMKYIFPTLSRGLLEIARQRPEDPIDYLAEFLFKENPEGKVFEAENNERARRRFQEMHKHRDTLAALANLDRKEEETFFPEEVRNSQQVADDPYDKYY